MIASHDLYYVSLDHQPLGISRVSTDVAAGNPDISRWWKLWSQIASARKDRNLKCQKSNHYFLAQLHRCLESVTTPWGGKLYWTHTAQLPGRNVGTSGFLQPTNTFIFLCVIGHITYWHFYKCFTSRGGCGSHHNSELCLIIWKWEATGIVWLGTTVVGHLIQKLDCRFF